MDVYKTTLAIGLLSVHKHSPSHPQQIHIGHKLTLLVYIQNKEEEQVVLIQVKKKYTLLT